MRDGPGIAQLITLMNNLSRLSCPLNKENVLISLKKNVVMDDVMALGGGPQPDRVVHPPNP